LKKSVLIKRFKSGNIQLLLASVWLLTIAFIFDNYWSAGSSLRSVQKEMNRYVKEQEADFISISNDHLIMDQILKNGCSDATVELLHQKKYHLYAYIKAPSGSDSLIFWNSSKIQPVSYMLYQQAKQGFVKMQNGYYVWKRIDRGTEKIIMLLPVQSQYDFSNEYLKNDFVISDINSKYFEITNESNGAVEIQAGNGETLFHVREIAGVKMRSNHPMALFFYISALICLLLWLHQTAVHFSRKLNIVSGILFFIISILAIRFLGLKFDFPIAFHQYDSFNPKLIQFGGLGHSIGDLFINAALFLWVMVYLRSRLTEWKGRDQALKPLLKYLMQLLSALVILISAYLASDIIRIIVNHPAISFEVFNFFSLDQFSVLGFLTLTLIAMSFFFLCQNLVIFHQKSKQDKFTGIWLLYLICGLLTFTMDGGKHFGNFHFYILCWVFVFMLFFPFRIFNLIASNTTASRSLFWLIYFSVSISSLLLLENRKKEIETRKKFAETLSIKSDQSNEVLVNTMLSDFKSEFVRLQFDRFKDPFSCVALKDSLLNDNTSNYDNNFDTRIYIYDANKKPLFNEDSTTFNQLNAILTTQAKPTRSAGLYYYDQSYVVFSYLFERVVNDSSGQLNGYLFVLSTPKKQRREAIYPELFTKGNNKSIENAEGYAIAIYHNGNIVRSINEYPFPSTIQNASLGNEPFTLRFKKGHQELWYTGNSNVTVAIVKAENFTLQLITLFSYLFCSFLLISLVFWSLGKLDGLSFSRFSLKKQFRLSIRNQIQGTIIFVSVLSFVIIGIATIMFFYDKYESANKDKLTRVIHIMEKEVDDIVDKNLLFKDSLSSQELSIRNKELEYAIKKIADIHGVDANMYDLNGDLIVASLNLPYTEGILSTKMDPIAFHHLVSLREIQYMQRENIGNLEFTSIYSPVTDKNGKLVAFLNIPYFTSQDALKLEISNFLIAIINLNAFIFLIAGVISFFITNRITATFSLIRDKMREINLDSTNETIKWNKDDEIGALVQEYNKMVQKLEASAKVMAASEREGAWKEMAQQVAHEIKNPLTPMKLSMQYLQKALDSKADNIEELTRRVVKTLIEQIDHLSSIANAFSQFARIGDAKKDIINLNDIIYGVCSLHQHHADLQLHISLIPENVYIYADKTQMNRLFTNLIINAIQAVEEGRQPEIFVTQKLEDQYVVTRIIDNGKGIDVSLQDKIFMPNFTTKTSGTGLGLAMCKRIVEQSDGAIWFESALGKGTSFYVKMPLHQS